MKKSPLDGYLRLAPSARIRAGDRKIYIGPMLGGPVYADEVGMRVSESGCHGVARRRRRMYFWKCQSCGLTFGRVTMGEPHRCPLCRACGCPSYVGYDYTARAAGG